jgi:hypothetical protein
MPRKRNVSQDKFIQNAIMDAILVQIETEKDVRYLSLDAENKSCTERSASYGITNEIIKRHKRANPWLTRDRLKNYKRSKAKLNTAGMPRSVEQSDLVDSNMSDLTDPTAIETPAALNEITNAASIEQRPRKKGGRPKGSTAASKIASKRSKQLALNCAATEASAIKESAAKTGDRVPKGTYEKIMCEAEAKYGLEEGTICKATMLTRLKKKQKNNCSWQG